MRSIPKVMSTTFMLGLCFFAGLWGVLVSLDETIAMRYGAVENWTVTALMLSALVSAIMGIAVSMDNTERERRQKQ